MNPCQRDSVAGAYLGFHRKQAFGQQLWLILEACKKMPEQQSQIASSIPTGGREGVDGSYLYPRPCQSNLPPSSTGRRSYEGVQGSAVRRIGVFE